MQLQKPALKGKWEEKELSDLLDSKISGHMYRDIPKKGGFEVRSREHKPSSM